MKQMDYAFRSHDARLLIRFHSRLKQCLLRAYNNVSKYSITRKFRIKIDNDEMLDITYEILTTFQMAMYKHTYYFNINFDYDDDFTFDNFITYLLDEISEDKFEEHVLLYRLTNFTTMDEFYRSIL